MTREQQEKVVYLAGRKRDRSKLIEQVLKEHGADMQRFLQLRLALEEDREDLIQELFIRLVRVDNLAERLAAESGSTRSYLFTILNNLILDLKRRRGRRGGEHESYDDDALTTRVKAPGPAASSRQQLERAMDILKKIEPKHRKAFVMHRFKNIGYREIADEMAVSMSTVERYIAAALTAIRKGLNNEQ